MPPAPIRRRLRESFDLIRREMGVTSLRRRHQKLRQERANPSCRRLIHRERQIYRQQIPFRPWQQPRARQRRRRNPRRHARRPEGRRHHHQQHQPHRQNRRQRRIIQIHPRHPMRVRKHRRYPLPRDISKHHAQRPQRPRLRQKTTFPPCRQRKPDRCVYMNLSALRSVTAPSIVLSTMTPASNIGTSTTPRSCGLEDSAALIDTTPAPESAPRPEATYTENPERRAMPSPMRRHLSAPASSGAAASPRAFCNLMLVSRPPNLSLRHLMRTLHGHRHRRRIQKPIAALRQRRILRLARLPSRHLPSPRLQRRHRIAR